MTAEEVRERLIGIWRIIPENKTQDPTEELEFFPNGIYILTTDSLLDESNYKLESAQRGDKFYHWITISEFEFSIEKLTSTQLVLINNTVRGVDKKYMRAIELE